MGNYSKTNFLDIDGSSQNDKVQALFARKYLDSTELGVSLFRYAPNYQAERAHSHSVQEEVYVVAGGSGRILIDGEVLELKQWDVIRLAPEAVRAFAADGSGLDIIAVGGQKPAEGDGIPVDAQWPEN